MQPAQVLKKVGQETGKPGALRKDELILIPRLGITLGNVWVTVPELLQNLPQNTCQLSVGHRHGLCEDALKSKSEFPWKRCCFQL